MHLIIIPVFTFPPKNLYQVSLESDMLLTVPDMFRTVELNSTILPPQPHTCATSNSLVKGTSKDFKIGHNHNKSWRLRMNQTRISQHKSRWVSCNLYCISNSKNLIGNIFSKPTAWSAEGLLQLESQCVSLSYFLQIKPCD